MAMLIPVFIVAEAYLEKTPHSAFVERFEWLAP
jgi:hypothetical protein